MLGIVGSGDEESLSNTCGCHLTIMEEKNFLKRIVCKNGSLLYPRELCR